MYRNLKSSGVVFLINVEDKVMFILKYTEHSFMLFDDLYRHSGYTFTFNCHTIFDDCSFEFRDASANQVCIPHNHTVLPKNDLLYGVTLMNTF